MFEVLQREKEKKEKVTGIWQLCAILLGFGVMMVIEILGMLVHNLYPLITYDNIFQAIMTMTMNMRILVIIQP